MTTKETNRAAQEVVVVNDDPGQLAVLTGLLRKADLEPSAFTDADAALDALDPGCPPALVISDLYMPGIDGWAFCRLLRAPDYAAFNQVPIVLVSATFAGEEGERIAADLGAEAFFSAPVDGTVFVEKIQDILRGKTQGGRPRVLVVDDEKSMAGLLKHCFQTRGYEVHAVYSIAEAQEALLSSTYQIAVIDYHLPDGDGARLLDMLNEQNANCVGIMITGDPHPDLALDWIKRGAAGYVRKPFQPAYLMELCARLQRERALSRTPKLLEKRTRALWESEHRYQQLFEHSRDGIVMVDLKKRVLNANGAYCRMTGYTLEELRRLPDANALTPTSWREWEQEEIVEKRLLADGYTGLYEKECIRKDGTVFPVEIQSFVVFSTEESPEYVWSITRDISRRKSLERHLRQSHKMQSIGRLAGGVAHDFNNIVGVILGYAQVGLGEVDEEHMLYESLKEIEEAACRASQLIRQLLAFASQEPIAPQSLDLNESVSDMLSMLRRLIGEHAELKWSPGETLWRVNLDPSQMDQVLVNLCVNARDALEGAGCITITTENVTLHRAPDSRYMEARAGSYVCLSVSDNGCGMEPKTRDNIFEPFYSTKDPGKGTGLGLATVYGIVKQNNGFIEVDSRRGEGTNMRVFFPRHATGDDVDTAAEPAPAEEVGRETILLVEDDTALLHLAGKTLEDLGYTVLSSSDPVEAIRMAEPQLDRIDLVLTDVIMPGMNGVQLYERLAQKAPQLKVLYMSGYASGVISASGIKGERLLHFIQKPFSRKSLARTIRQALGETKTDT